MSHRVAVNVVAWNSMPYLPGLVASLREQAWTDFALTVVDNASADGTVEWLAGEAPDAGAIRNFRNLGFSRAHNQGIAFALAKWAGEDLSKKYVLIANPDLEFGADSIRTLVEFMDAHPEAMACGPKLLRAIRRGEGDDGHPIVERTTVIDAVGIGLRRSRRSFDRGAGEEDKGQYDGLSEVFGLSGACVMLRASALEALKEADGVWFDDQFFAYKEDVDLAWRMLRFGMPAFVVPQAIVWHHRRAQDAKQGFLWLGALRRRARKPPHVNRLSWRNHWWLLMKNEELGNGLVHAPWIGLYEFGKLCIAVISPSSGWPAIREGIAGLPDMWRKRRALARSAVVKGKGIRKWIGA